MSCHLIDSDDDNNDDDNDHSPDSVLVDIVQEPQTRLLAAIDVLLSVVWLGNLQMS